MELASLGSEEKPGGRAGGGRASERSTDRPSLGTVLYSVVTPLSELICICVREPVEGSVLKTILNAFSRRPSVFVRTPFNASHKTGPATRPARPVRPGQCLTVRLCCRSKYCVSTAKLYVVTRPSAARGPRVMKLFTPSEQ